MELASSSSQSAAAVGSRTGPQTSI
jgi:hypothetical protein